MFIDGLADFHGNRIFNDYRDVAGLKPGWRDVLDRWNVDLVLVPADSGLAAELTRDSLWDELYRDDIAALIQRKSEVVR